MLEEPKGMKYWYIDEKTELWKIRDNAPEWAKQEFEEYQKAVNPEPDDDGIITIN